MKLNETHLHYILIAVTAAVIFGAMFSLNGCSKTDIDYAPICEGPSVEGTEAYVVGGSVSTDRRATVKVIMGGGYCSGTIIGPHTVLTAGHCKDPRIIAVEDVAAFEVAEHFAHPGYNGNVRTDLRIVYVEEQLPEPYAEIATPALECAQLLVQGYGSQGGGVGGDGQLWERRVETVLRYEEVIIVTEGSCNGDSGGPLYALRYDGSYAIVGVTSFGAAEPNVCDSVGGYMNLLKLGDWVNEQIR